MMIADTEDVSAVTPDLRSGGAKQSESPRDFRDFHPLMHRCGASEYRFASTGNRAQGWLAQRGPFCLLVDLHSIGPLDGRRLRPSSVGPARGIVSQIVGGIHRLNPA